MNHKLHGRWRSFVVGEDDNGDVFADPDDFIILKMTNPNSGTVEQGSTHMGLPITGEYDEALKFLDLRQEHLGRHYQGFLISEPDAQNPNAFIIAGRVINEGVGPSATADTEEESGEQEGKGKRLTDTGQEEGTWMATKP